jgi:hypothetical protein
MASDAEVRQAVIREERMTLLERIREGILQ